MLKKLACLNSCLGFTTPFVNIQRHPKLTQTFTETFTQKLREHYIHAQKILLIERSYLGGWGALEVSSKYCPTIFRLTKVRRIALHELHPGLIPYFTPCVHHMFTNIQKAPTHSYKISHSTTFTYRAPAQRKVLCLRDSGAWLLKMLPNCFETYPKEIEMACLNVFPSWTSHLTG